MVKPTLGAFSPSPTKWSVSEWADFKNVARKTARLQLDRLVKRGFATSFHYTGVTTRRVKGKDYPIMSKMFFFEVCGVDKKDFLKH